MPPKSNIRGMQIGNWMWRSPEAHARGRVNKPSDMFSFGIVVSLEPCANNRNSWLEADFNVKCIYAVLKRVIFAVEDEELAKGEDRLERVLERQVSYFSDWDSLEAFLRHIHDSPLRETFETIRGRFGEASPREPFSLWQGIDLDFKHLVAGLTNFDPAKRMTAQEALAHEWFDDVRQAGAA